MGNRLPGMGGQKLPASTFFKIFWVLEGVYENSPWDEGWKGEGNEGGNDKKHEWCIFINLLKFWNF